MLAASRYIGIPYAERGRDRDGIDCYGLLRLVYREQLGVDLPSYADAYDPKDRADIARVIGERLTGWYPVWTRASGVPLDEREVRPGDGVRLRILGDDCHVGVVLDPPWFLHAQAGTLSCRERWDSPRWTRRLLGVYRHEALAC